MANDVSTLTAQKREQAGKGPSHRLRAKGLIPAVCYGPYEKPLHVAVDPEAIKKAIATPHKFNTVIKLQVDGGETRTVLFKDFEKDPVDGNMLHADFLEVRMDKDVVVNVPVILTGKPEGVTAGGILQQVARTLPVQCKPSDIPEKIEVDVSALNRMRFAFGPCTNTSLVLASAMPTDCAIRITSATESTGMVARISCITLSLFDYHV